MNVLQETRPSGEAGLIIPDLSSVDFLGMHGRTLLMGGLGVCALGVAMLWAGERAGRERDAKWTYLLAYLIALAVPLHLSALVAAPVAIMLAAYTPTGIRWPLAWTLTGEFVLAVGVGRMSPAISVAGAVVVVLAMAIRKASDGRWALRIPMNALSVLVIAGLAWGERLIALPLRGRMTDGEAARRGDRRRAQQREAGDRGGSGTEQRPAVEGQIIHGRLLCRRPCRPT